MSEDDGWVGEDASADNPLGDLLFFLTLYVHMLLFCWQVCICTCKLNYLLNYSYSIQVAQVQAFLSHIMIYTVFAIAHMDS